MSLIDRPKELLELINECLKPKQVEKQKYGEVFTQMNIVDEMLDKLPQEVWTNKKLKWFDPAVGMGNFPIAVYLRQYQMMIVVSTLYNRMRLFTAEKYIIYNCICIG